MFTDPQGNTITRRYVYDDENLLFELDGQNTVLTEFTPGPGLDEPLTMTRNGQTYTYHSDALGSIIAITDARGAVVQRYEYDAYGNLTYQQDPGFKQPYAYTGREWDEESGLYYYRARYYDPGVGRFIQSDPIGLAGGINLYAYVGNNPINWIDPLGLVARDCECKDDNSGYWQNVTQNFANTNNAIPGMGVLLPTGVGLATAGVTAQSIGSITFFQTLGFIGTGNFGGAIIFAGITTAVNVLAVGGALQGGILVGSMINSIPMGQCGRTLRDSISDLF